jgi:ATP-dependent DNA ligase
MMPPMPTALPSPVQPQLAITKDELPLGEEWVYEPKLDGFRTIVFVDGDEHTLQSRGGKPMDRYFPELAFPPGDYVLDGELIVPTATGNEDFEALQQRIHPAASRVKMLAEQTPAVYVAFDLLAQDGESLLGLPQQERRAKLEALGDPVVLIEQTADPDEAAVWLRTREGVIAKQSGAPYRPGERVGMVKIRRTRTIDCVAIGYRNREKGGGVASLILALYEPDGTLRPVGHTSGFTAKRARELVDVVTPLESGEMGEPGPTRWSRGRDSAWFGLRPELVCEVSFEHVSGGRIRHGARLERFRDDKQPSECTVDQIEQ